VTKAGTTFTRTYDSLPSHTLIQFSIYFWIIDLNKASTLYEVFFDGSSIGVWDSQYYANAGYYNFASDTCGGSAGDFANVLINGEVPHTQNTLTIQIVSKYTTGVDAFSFGFRNINLLFRTPSPSAVTLSVCNFGSTSAAQSSCLCSAGSFDPPGSSGCTSCYSTCQNCVGTHQGDCTQCDSGYSYDGTKCILCDSSCSQCFGTASNQCAQCPTGKYLAYDNTCRSSCSSPLVATTTGSFSICSLPCGTSGFYYQNNTCGSGCTSPFTQTTINDVKYCNFPCTSPDWLNSAGTCQSSCDPPYTQVIKGVERYCDMSVSCGSTEYLYENNTCIEGCNSPVFVASTVGSVNYCNFSCSGSTPFYNWNGVCQASCDSPYVSRSQDVENYCDLPCGSTGFLYQNNSCKGTCDFPFTKSISGDVKYCNFPCSGITSWLNWNNDCQGACDSPLIPTITGVEKYCALPCGTSGYLYENNTCQDSCAFPFVQSTDQDVQYCNFLCADSKFLYWNNTCSYDCDSPLVSITNGVEKYCQLPCGTENFHYQNGSCLPTCDYPFAQNIDGDSKSCDLPCSGSDYLYWDGSCQASCPSSFQNNIDGVGTCNFYCPTNEFIYWNQTCQTSCDSPLKVTVNSESYQFCRKPCGDDDYLYNNACQSDCNYQIDVDNNGVQYCTYPCQPGQYMYQNTSCHGSCHSPFVNVTTADNLWLCNSPCSATQYYRVEKGACINYCSYPLTVTVDGVLKICQNVIAFAPSDSDSDNSTSTNTTTHDTETNSTSNSTTFSEKVLEFAKAASNLADSAAYMSKFVRSENLNSVFVIGLAKLIKYVQYINVTMPQDVRDAFTNKPDDAFSLSSLLSFKMPQSLKQEFTIYPLPEVFIDKNLHSSYLVNQWETLSTLSILFVMGLLFTMTEKITRNSKREALKLVVQRLKMITRWNFLLFMMFNCYDDLTLFTILELKSLHLNSFTSIWSFIVCCVITLLAIYVLLKVFRISRAIVKSKRQIDDARNTPNQSLKVKFESFEVIYAGLKSDSIFKQLYFFIFAGRFIVNYLIVGFLYDHPLFQTISLFAVSLLMVLYMGWLRPTKGYLSFIVISGFELMALIVNFCLVVLAVMDTRDVSDSELRDKLLQVIIVLNTVMSLSTCIFMWIYILILAHSAYVLSKTPGIPSKLYFINVLFAVYRSPGMGFLGEDPYSDDYEQDSIIIKNGEKHLKLLKNRKVHPMISSQRPSILDTTASKASTPGAFRLSIKNSTSDNLLTSATQVDSVTSKKTSETNTKKFFDLKLNFMSDSEIETTPENGSGLFSPPWGSHELSNNNKMIQDSTTVQIGRPLISPKAQTPPDVRVRNHMRMKSAGGGTLSTLRKPPSIILEEMSPSQRLGDESPYVGFRSSNRSSSGARHERSISFMSAADKGVMNRIKEDNGEEMKSPEFRKPDESEALQRNLELFKLEESPEEDPLKSFQAYIKTWKGKKDLEEVEPNENGFQFSESNSSPSPDARFNYQRDQGKASSINLEINNEKECETFRKRSREMPVIPEVERTRDEIGESNSTLEEVRRGRKGQPNKKDIVSGLLYPYQGGSLKLP